MAETKEAPREGKEGEKEGKKGLHVPEWVWTWLRNLAYALIVALAGAAWGIYRDNIESKKDIARETWRNDKQDERQNRLEMRQDRFEEALADVRENQHEFQDEALHRLDILLEKQAKEARRKR